MTNSLILIKEVRDYKTIEKIRNDNPAVEPLECIYRFDRTKRVFVRVMLEKPSILDKIINRSKFEDLYYICNQMLVIPIEKKEIKLKIEPHKIAKNVKIRFEIQFDLYKSDAGRGLMEWLVNHFGDDTNIVTLTKETLTKKVQDVFLAEGVLESKFDLKNHFVESIERGGIPFDKNELRNVLGCGEWLSVEAQVVTATGVDTKTQQVINQIMQEQRISQLQQDNEPVSQNNEWENIQFIDAKTIEGKLFPSEHLVVEINGINLELESKQKVVLGREKADVSLLIPQECIGTENKNDENDCISNKHALVEKKEKYVLIKSMIRPFERISKDVNPSSITFVKLNDDLLTEEGKTFSSNVTLRFGASDWQCRVQQGVNDAREIILSSLVLNHHACVGFYKIFVWPSCNLKAVDSRLPNWRIAYQAGAHGSEGAFYVTTARGRSMYLNPQLSVVEDVAVHVITD